MPLEGGQFLMSEGPRHRPRGGQFLKSEVPLEGGQFLMIEGPVGVGWMQPDWVSQERTP